MDPFNPTYSTYPTYDDELPEYEGEYDVKKETPSPLEEEEYGIPREGNMLSRLIGKVKNTKEDEWCCIPFVPVFVGLKNILQGAGRWTYNALPVSLRTRMDSLRNKLFSKKELEFPYYYQRRPKTVKKQAAAQFKKGIFQLVTPFVFISYCYSATKAPRREEDLGSFSSEEFRNVPRYRKLLNGEVAFGFREDQT